MEQCDKKISLIPATKNIDNTIFALPKILFKPRCNNIWVRILHFLEWYLRVSYINLAYVQLILITEYDQSFLYYCTTILV